ncbi:cysteine desulfurase [Microtetraspora sp. NBRC 13810]|uniref:cysteine desulfurase family protein n=1 Tax=Microtetraspora sp. NBRC 13810 TaxID=3030990 RepID=UPI0024A360E6|nr:cysteine desulfurase family protein [Microtetraspora sp. NBRC 13810]GLW11616.1 cysteine desulfurase [Microtetraspora sp. NBRC 13810]
MAHPGLDPDVIYCDYNATTPVDPRVSAAAWPYFSGFFGNPSTSSPYAEGPRRALRVARRQVAELLGAGPEEIVFTSGGSESDTMAVRGVAVPGGGHVVTQVTEHPAVLRSCESLERLHGVRVTYLPVDADGLVDPLDLEAALTPRTRLVSIMLANGETGVVQRVAELAEIAHRRGALFHTDAAQAVGKIPVSVAELGVDLLTVAGHKLYAPKGVGALFVRRGVSLEPTIYGGGQERGLRAGTENVAYAVALGAAAEIAAGEVDREGGRLRGLRDLLHRRLSALLPGRVLLNGHTGRRLPGTLNISVSGTGGSALLAATPGIAAATGSACHTGEPDPSGVLLAMGLGHERARGAVRLSLGRWTTRPEVEAVARLLAESARRLG